MTPVATPRRQRHEPVGKGPVVGSVLIHCVAIFLAWWMSAIEREIPNFIVYEIELVSPPAAELGDPTPPPPEELVIETPFVASAYGDETLFFQHDRGPAATPKTTPAAYSGSGSGAGLSAS